MSITLEETLTQYASALATSKGDSCQYSAWDQAIAAIFQKKNLSRELLTQLVEECRHISVETRQEYLLLCQRVLSIVLLYKFSHIPLSEMRKECLDLYVKLIRHQYPPSWQLACLYKIAIGLFLGEKGEGCKLRLTPGGLALVECQGQDPQLHLPHFLQNAELALLASVIALMTHQSELLDQAVEMSLGLARLVKECKGFPEGLWTQEAECHLTQLSWISALLFHLSFFIAPCAQTQEAYQTITQTLHTLPFEELGSLYPLFYLLVSEVTDTPLNVVTEGVKAHSPSMNNESKYLGYVTYCYEDFSCYCTVSGAGSGFAGFSKGPLRITSVGPHTGALGEMQGYGIYRTPLLQQTPFKDVVMERQDKKLSFTGWTGVVAGTSRTPKPGTSWLQIQLDVQEKKALLTTQWVSLQSSPEPFVVFFVKGKKAVVDKNYHLHPNTLDRYQGKAVDISFHDQHALLNIKTTAPCMMQVIPLAGSTSFWGAHFLVAYSLPQNHRLLWEIS